MSAEERVVAVARIFFPFNNDPRPWVEVDPDNWAHGPWTALAVTLAEPLRRAFHEHVTGCETCQTRGISNCPTGYELAGLLPAGDLVVIG